MATFHEMMNTISYRGLAGRVHREADLLPLRDILVEYQSSFIRVMDCAYSNFLLMGQHEEAQMLLVHIQATNARLEKDIVTIETWLRVRQKRG